MDERLPQSSQIQMYAYLDVLDYVGWNLHDTRSDLTSVDPVRARRGRLSFKLGNASLISFYLFTIMPARIAFATLRNFGLSSSLRFCVFGCLVKVVASHSRT